MKLRQQSIDDLQSIRVRLEKNVPLTRVTKSKKKPITTKYMVNQTQSLYYQHVMRELQARQLRTLI